MTDVRATQEYYRDVLGFRIAWIWEDGYGAAVTPTRRTPGTTR